MRTNQDVGEAAHRLDTIAAERDQRRAPRYSTRDLAIVTIGQSTDVLAGESYPVQLHDLSPRGARFIGRVPMSRGDTFVIYLPNGLTRVALLSTVVHSVKRADGLTIVGSEFSCVIGQNANKPDTPACIEEAELARIRQMMLS